MSACQVCGEPLVAIEEAGNTLSVCSKWLVHPAIYFGIERLGRLRQWRGDNQAGAPLNGVAW